MDYSQLKYVKPLEYIENAFLEVLIHDFTLTAKREGAELKVRYDHQTPAIWQDKGRREVRQGISEFDHKRRQYQTQLDDILLRQSSSVMDYYDPDFPFRYVSGGTLPVINLGGTDYYCLSYREIFPAGWNIANGGLNTRDELLNPIDVVERELREEIIAFDMSEQKLFVYDHASGKPRNRPEYLAAELLWQHYYARQQGVPSLEQMDEEAVGTGFIGGPDSLVVEGPDGTLNKCSGVFLNVNAEDFGIEIDKIGKISFPTDNLRLFDGEVAGGEPINSMVGLFEVSETNKAIEQGCTCFTPNIVYYGGQRWNAEDVKNIAREDFVPRMAARFGWDRSEWDKVECKFDLCPVTRRIIQRCLGSTIIIAPPSADLNSQDRYDVFISFPYEPVAMDLATKLSARIKASDRSVFFSVDQESSRFAREINLALESANCFVAVLTRPEQVYRNWVDYECTTFLSLIMNGLKPENAQMLSLVSSFDPRRLLPPLTASKSEACDWEGIDQDLAIDRLMKWVGIAPPGMPFKREII